MCACVRVCVRSEWWVGLCLPACLPACLPRFSVGDERKEGLCVGGGGGGGGGVSLRVGVGRWVDAAWVRVDALGWCSYCLPACLLALACEGRTPACLPTLSCSLYVPACLVAYSPAYACPACKVRFATETRRPRGPGSQGPWSHLACVSLRPCALLHDLLYAAISSKDCWAVGTNNSSS